MATKLNATNAKRVKALGINVKTEEEAREQLLEILTSNGIDGMEEEDIDTLVEIAESFVEEVEETADPEEAENDELAKEVEEEEAKEVEEEEETEEDDDFDGMSRAELKDFIKENDLDVKVKKSMSDDDIREAIRSSVEEVEEEEEAPKKAEKKEAPKKAVPAKENKPADKKVGKRGAKLDPKNNEEDRQYFAPLKELFPESEYAYSWVASAGVTIKHKGKNSQRSMVLVENCSIQADESIKCNLYLLTFTKSVEILDKAGIEYEICWSGAPLLKAITLEEVVEVIKSLMEHITATVQKIDKKLGENRKKMEENLNKKSPSKKTAAKVKEPEKDDDEVE